MQDLEIRSRLRLSLQDGRFDRGERDELREWLDSLPADGMRCALYQSMAFDLVREAMETNSVPPHSALNWLERVVKVLTPFASNLAPKKVAEAWFSPQQDGTARIVRLFDEAKQSADVCVFTITDDRISTAILSAHQRGVRIRVITDNEKRLDPGSDIARLVGAGLAVRQDNTEYHMHHKFAVFDRWLLLTGSYNWTRSASLHNEENFILTGETGLVQPFGRMFDELWEKFQPQH